MYKYIKDFFKNQLTDRKWKDNEIASNLSKLLFRKHSWKTITQQTSYKGQISNEVLCYLIQLPL